VLKFASFSVMGGLLAPSRSWTGWRNTSPSQLQHTWDLQEKFKLSSNHLPPTIISIHKLHSRYTCMFVVHILCIV